MRILPFTVPVKKEESITTNHEIATQFYPLYHRHEELQIIFIKHGSGSLLFNNKIFSFQSEALYVIGSNQAHVFKNAHLSNRKTKIESLNIFINSSGSLEALYSLPEWQQTSSFLNNIGLAFLDNCHLSNAYVQMHSILTLNGPQKIISLLNFIEWLRPLLIQLSSRGTKTISDTDGSRLDEVIQFIWKKFSEEISLTTCAQHVNMSPEAFSRYFKKRTNTNFINYLNELRIHHSCKLMNRFPEMSISEIASRCGYNHQTHFNRVFKKILEKTPLQYKQEFRQF